MKIPNPFRGLEHPKAVWAWGMYDLANQSFQLLINTLLFSIYLSKVVIADDVKSKTIWGAMFFASNALVVLASPVLGAIGDARAWKKKILVGAGVACAALMACFPLLGPGMVALAVALYVPAAFCCGIGENFLASFLPELASREQMGRVSAIGWTMSYVGALVLLAVCAAAVYLLSLSDPSQWRGLFVLAAAWFGLGILPAAMVLRERARPGMGAPLGNGAQRAEEHRLPGAEIGGTVRGAVSRVIRSLREARRFSQLARFLAIFFVYSMGTQTVVFFAGLIGDSFGFGIGELILMALVMAVAAGASAILTGLFQDRVGHRRTIMMVLGVWVLASAGLGLMQVTQAPRGWFWMICAGVGFGLGGIGTSSRALVGVFTPERRSAEFFGLWGMVYKLASIGGVLFGVAGQSSRYGLFLITGFFGAGLALMMLVDPRRGMDEARAAEGEAGVA